jgi:hypothetical protein
MAQAVFSERQAKLNILFIPIKNLIGQVGSNLDILSGNMRFKVSLIFSVSFAPLDSDSTSHFTAS